MQLMTLKWTLATPLPAYTVSSHVFSLIFQFSLKKFHIHNGTWEEHQAKCVEIYMKCYLRKTQSST